MPEIDPITFQSINMALSEGICLFLVLYSLGKLWFIWPPLDGRLEEVKAIYGNGNALNLKISVDSQFRQRKRKKGKRKLSLKHRFLAIILKNSLGGDETLKASFEQAGWTARDTQSIYIASKLICLCIGVTVGYIVIVTIPYFSGLSRALNSLLMLFMGFSGWLLPDLYLRGVIKSRVQMIEKQFPDALDLIVICLQAGLGLNRAIERVAKEFAVFGKEIARELMMTSIELEIMLDRRQALQNLYSRVPSAIIRSFSTTVLQSIQQGTPTLQALDILSKEIRDTRMQKAENKAARLPSLMVIPLVLFVMPNLFIVLLGPAIVRLMNVT